MAETGLDHKNISSIPIPIPIRDSHDTKTTTTENDGPDSDINIRLINEAKSILLDPHKRARWLDTYPHSESHAGTYYQSISNPSTGVREDGPHIFRNISLDEFTPHYESDQEHNGNLDSGIQLTAAKDEDRDDKDRDRTEQEEEEEGEAQWYTYPCRCSGQFKITVEQLEQNVEVVGCEWCGEWIRVGYEVVLDDADSNAGEDADEEERE